jgi:D-serine deaminase-like pyridoxal phosphate-dependent protein
MPTMLDDIETPAVLVDLDILDANIARLQHYLSAHQLANRPHIKTHKIPAIAHLQVAAGAVGITCQKIGEAEVMAEAGLTDIFLPYNILGPAKLERLMDLARRVRLSVIADSEMVVGGLSAAAQATGQILPVLVECDTGAARCGVQTPQAGADLAHVIAHAPGLHFGGLMTYPNSERFDPFMREAKALLAARGLTAERVSGGGTATASTAHTYQELTEHRAGEYVYGHRGHILAGVMPLADCALRVLATVVSRPTSERGILDSGSKTLSSDLCRAAGYGLIVEYPDALINKLTEEHGHVDLSACAHRPEIGERVSVIPNHCCPVSNLANQVYGIRRGQVEVIWSVAGKGRVQ